MKGRVKGVKAAFLKEHCLLCAGIRKGIPNKCFALKSGLYLWLADCSFSGNNIKDNKSALSRNDKHTNRFSTSIGMKVACWNVRTLFDKELLERPHHRTALFARELSLYDIDIAGLSETRLTDVGQLTETGSCYTFFWKRKPAYEAREHGVGFAIKSSLSKNLL